MDYARNALPQDIVALEPVSYALTDGRSITLTYDDVVKYIARGQEISAADARRFMWLCESLKLDFRTGEAFLVKYGNEAQLVVGLAAYTRRASENPNYLGMESGVVVMRDKQIIEKKGSAWYKQLNEELIGGWARVFHILNGVQVETYKQVSMEEYSSGKSNWEKKPGTMIEKVAKVHALREAFPKDYNGMYIGEEFDKAPPPESPEDRMKKAAPIKGVTMATAEQRQEMIVGAKTLFGDQGGEWLVSVLKPLGYSNTAVTLEHYEMVISMLNEIADTSDSISDLGM